MYSRKLFYSLLLFLLFNTPLNAKIYEDAEDTNVIRWNILSTSKEGTIRIVYDRVKKSNVITFEGESQQSIYILPLDDNNTLYPSPQKILLQWEMQYPKDYRILIRINTIKGIRTLIYTSKSREKMFQYELGEDSISSKWKKYTRNIQKDLQQYEPDNQLLSLTSFVISGNGKIDNIQLVEEEPIQSKKPKAKKKIPKINIPIPTIKLQGENPLILKKGEAYIEMGATAYDVNGSKLDITISNDIDINSDGEYTVMYLTTNSIGNSAIDKRIVRVGKVPIPKEIEATQEDDAEVDIEQISPLNTSNKLAGEKAFFDKTLSKIKKTIHPSRPGL